jgi:hypothetical protein
MKSNHNKSQSQSPGTETNFTQALLHIIREHEDDD